MAHKEIRKKRLSKNTIDISTIHTRFAPGPRKSVVRGFESLLYLC